MTDRCTDFNVEGERCQRTIGIVGGKCEAHREGGRERLASIAASGGAATAARNSGQPLEDKDLRAIETTDDAKLALVDIRNYVATRRITHAEGNAMSKSIEAWLKADAAGQTRTVIDELKVALQQREREIAELKAQMAAAGRARSAVAH